MHNIKLNPSDIIFWFNAIRNLPTDERTRGLDAFWSGQLDSKVWLAEMLNQYYKHQLPADIYIFGGWVGVLASILFQSSEFYVNKIYNIDIDPWCESVAKTVNEHNHRINRFQALTLDMAKYEYRTKPDIVINTSTEHISQETYDTWYNNIPTGTTVVIQGNDFFSCNEHIRCSNNLKEFAVMNHALNPIYVGELPTDIYNRYMCIFKKT